MVRTHSTPPTTFQQHLQYVKHIVAQDGPEVDEYQHHLSWYADLNRQIEAGEITEQQRDLLRAEFGSAYSIATLQGYVYTWPLGYAGDYRMIEKIYQHSISPDPRFQKYDLFFQRQLAPQAVRNRKQYFQQLVRKLCEKSSNPISVLNLASGPCREIRELLDESPDLPVNFVCVEYDPQAVQHATVVTHRHSSKIEFVTKNVFRYKPQQRFSLIWSAGLFDYFDDGVFCRILKRFLSYLERGGEVVIGNFGMENTTKDYMEAIGKWYLHHRSDDLLEDLAHRAGVSDEHCVAIGAEPTGVNRFLHVGLSERTVRVDLPHRLSKPNFTPSSLKPIATDHGLTVASEADVEEVG